MSSDAEPLLVELHLLSTVGLTERSLDSGVLDQAERDRGAAFVRPRDRISYLAAHIALRRLLGGRLGVPADTVRYTRLPCPCCGAPHGRPALADPTVPLHFSLSHGGDLILIGTAGQPVGVDVEPYPAPDAVPGLVGVLHPVEQAELARLSAQEDLLIPAFAQLWTRKEAYLKGLGTGLGRDLGLDYLGSEAPGLSPPDWTVADVPVDPQHAAAYAVPTASSRSALTRMGPDLVR